jgi:predicted transcriptional regulator of viral defense system
MSLSIRSLSPQESRVLLALSESGKLETTRAEIAGLHGGTEKAVDNLIEGLRHKGWLERAARGTYLVIPPEQGPDRLGNSNLLALASRRADPYYIGYGTAAAHYGLTTQHRSVIYVVTPQRRRERTIQDSQVRIVTLSKTKFFGFGSRDVLGYSVMLSDREKTAIDCIDHPQYAGGVGEVAVIVATASRRFDWNRAVDYLERMHTGALARRFGWLADHVKADMPPKERARIQTIAALSRHTWLGAPEQHPVRDAIGYDETWRVFINVPREELHGSSGLGQRKQILKGE